jgi:two-component system NtrC family sensor kinase
MFQRFINKLFGGRLQVLLIACFAFVVTFTVLIGASGTARLIQNYLSEAENERVARDMDLARSFYDLKLQDITFSGYRLANDPVVAHRLPQVLAGDDTAFEIIDDEVLRWINDPTCECVNMILVLDQDGRLALGRVRSTFTDQPVLFTDGDWSELPIVQSVLQQQQGQTATEVIPLDLLQQVDLEERTNVAIIPTERAAPSLFDPREGQAGLALVGVYPIRNEADELIGSVLTGYLFNNDFTLVDRIKRIADIDTVTVFFGDLRVSTNVLNEDGTRAVGTRVSQEVYDTVLVNEETYQGRAFVVNQWYITRYEPILDHLGQVVGILYVGSRVSAFQSLLASFNRQVALIAIVSILMAAIISIPITRFITRPIAELVQANRRLAQGNMAVRVPDYGQGELGELGRSFNTMVETLHRTQEELLHKEKLASMGQLSAGVAHEINNPLASILLFADMMYKDCAEDDPRRDDLRMIINETTRCKNIVADLLNFARQQNVMAQETDLHALLERTLEAVLRLPAYQNVKVARNFDPQVTTIQGDPAQLQQVFTNLLNNAAEAMPLGGTITLETNRTSREQVEIRVSDTGQGISKEDMGKLFTPFFTTKGPGKGTGLGLSIVYGIIKMHRGQISVQSEEGVGTTFTVTLPVQHPDHKLVLQSELIG